MVREQLYSGNDNDENSAKSSVNTVIQLDFVKSALTVNPCMVRFLTSIHNVRLFLLFYIIEPSKSSLSTRR